MYFSPLKERHFLLYWTQTYERRGDDMDVKLTLQEQLNYLRRNRQQALTLEEVSAATGISTATLSRFETDDRQDIPYQSLLKLADFYGVSMDYLCGRTTVRAYCKTPVEELSLTDEVIALLKSGKVNNRMICELLSYGGFSQLLGAIEVYLDRALSQGVRQSKVTFDFIHQTMHERGMLRENVDVMGFLKEVTASDEDYLRFRISERFNLLLKQWLDDYKQKFKTSKSENEELQKLKEELDTYTKEREDSVRQKYHWKARQLGLNTRDLTEEENRVLMKAISKSTLLEKRPGKGGRRR